MSIYVVATRCREPFIRRDAIAPLREWPSKNGIWDSLHIAQVAEWIMGIEEEVARGSNNIPEEARVRMSSLKVTTRRGGSMWNVFKGMLIREYRGQALDFHEIN
jgi:hypothetical protein